MGPNTKVGLIVEIEKLGFSFSMNSQAAFSANALLAAHLLGFTYYRPRVSSKIV